jgi:hypothetical protein
LPKIAELSNQYRFICKVSFSADTAVLKIIDLDDPNQFLEFTSPMASANVRGAQDIQNMGAVQTYMRRYLYMMAFEIVDNDTFDGAMGKQPQNPAPKNNGNSPQKPNGNGQNGANSADNGRKTEIGVQIKEILETKNPEGQPYFKPLEIEQERNNWNKGDLQAVEKQLERLKGYLEKRKAAYAPPPFSDEHPEFVDDMPF